MKSMTKRLFGAFGVLAIVAAVLMFSACPDNSKTEAKKYTVTIEKTGEGEASSSPAKAASGTTVTITVEPAANWRIGSVQYNDGNGDLDCEPVEGQEGKYTFIMSKANVTVNVVFIEFDKFMVTLAAMQNGTFKAEPESAYAGDEVIVTALPASGYEYRGNTLKITGKVSGDEISAEPVSGAAAWKIEMPEEDVTLFARFKPEGKEISPITLVQTNNGTIISSEEEGLDGEEIILTLKPTDETYRYKADSLAITPAADTEITYDAAKHEWKATFTMPNKAISITAAFEEIPLWSFDGTVANGTITATPSAEGKIREGALVTVTLSITTPADYRYVADSFNVMAGTEEVELTPVAGQALSWTFIMPTEDVSASATIEFIPYFAITKNAGANGSFTITGGGTGDYEGQARAGVTLTIVGAPDAGYKAVRPDVTPAEAVTFTSTGKNTWTFVMGAEALTISLEFDESGYVQIYSGGPKFPMTLGDLPTTNGTWGYGTVTNGHVVLEAEGEGRNGGSAIRLKANPDLATVGGEQSFAVNLTAPADLADSGALSFWVKASGNIPIAWVGMGSNYNEMVMWGGTFTAANIYNQDIAATATWQRYIVPIPVPKSENEMSRVFFFKVSGFNATREYYIDDIEFVSAARVELTSITIPASYPSAFSYPAPIKVSDLLGQHMRFTYTHDAGGGDVKSVTVYSPGTFGNLGHRWIASGTPLAGLTQSSDYTATVTGDVTLSEDGTQITPDKKGAQFTVALNFGGATSNAMTAEFTESFQVNIENFSTVLGRAGGWIGDFCNADWRYWRTTDTIATNDRNWIAASGQGDFATVARTGSARLMQITPSGAPAKIGRNFAPLDLTGTDTVSLWFRIREAGDTFVLALYNGGSLTNNQESGTAFTVPLTPGAVNTWAKIDIPLASFTGLDITKVTGWGIHMTAKTTNVAGGDNGAGGTYPVNSGRWYLDSIFAELSD